MTISADLVAEPTLAVVDGLRVVWAPGAGPRSHAGLVFRVGQADESLSTRGITHLLEHLALEGTGGSAPHNGETDLFTTTFTVSGTWSEIDTHLARVVANLRSLPEQRLDFEKQILAAEERGHSAGVFGQLALYRYGATGAGLTQFPEWGLPRIGAPALRDWADRYFSRENAVLVIVGPQPPDQLSWQLPAGEARATPEPAPPTSRVPSYAFDHVAGPALMAEVARSTAATAFTAIADRELMRHVRGELGLAYRASAGYVPVSANRAVIIAHTDSVDGQTQQTVDAFLDVLFRLASHGPDEQVLAEVAAMRKAALAEPNAAFALAHNAARNILDGLPITHQAELDRKFDALTPADVQAVASAVLRSAVVLLPHQARAIGRGGFTPIGVADSVPVEGKKIFLPNDPDGTRANLIIGTDGISRLRGDEAMTIRFTEVAALLRRSDGTRVLIANSADTIEVDPKKLGPTRMEQVDEAVPRDRWIDLAGPSAPVPEREDGTPKAPLTWYQKFLFVPLRAAVVALLVIIVFTLVWPMDAQENLIPPGDQIMLGLGIVAAYADHALYARRARRRNGERADHRANRERDRRNAEAAS